MTTFNKMVWKDRITDIKENNVLEVGTDLSANNFNRLEEGIESLLSLKADIEYNDMEIDMIRQNQIIYLMEEDILNKSTEMDVGYWFDSLKNYNKMTTLNNMTLENNTLNLTRQDGFVTFEEHDIEFVTNKVTLYLTTKSDKTTSVIKIPFTKEDSSTIRINNHDIKIRI